MVDTKKRARGRPRGFDAEAGVAAARELFARGGYDAVGVADLCARLGVRPPSLYAAYGSKRALFEAVLDRYDADAAAAYGAAAEGAADPADLRRRVLRTALDLYLRDGGVGCLVLANLAATADDDLRDRLAAVVADRREALRDRLAALGDTDPDAAVAAISVAMMGLSAAARAGRPRGELEAALGRLL